MPHDLSAPDRLAAIRDELKLAIHSDISTGVRLKVLRGPTDYSEVAAGAVDRVFVEHCPALLAEVDRLRAEADRAHELAGEVMALREQLDRRRAVAAPTEGGR